MDWLLDDIIKELRSIDLSKLGVRMGKRAAAEKATAAIRGDKQPVTMVRMSVTLPDRRKAIQKTADESGTKPGEALKAVALKHAAEVLGKGGAK